MASVAMISCSKGVKDELYYKSDVLVAFDWSTTKGYKAPDSLMFHVYPQWDMVQTAYKMYTTGAETIQLYPGEYKVLMTPAALGNGIDVRNMDAYAQAEVYMEPIGYDGITPIVTDAKPLYVFLQNTQFELIPEDVLPKVVFYPVTKMCEVLLVIRPKKFGVLTGGSCNIDGVSTSVNLSTCDSKNGERGRIDIPLKLKEGEFTGVFSVWDFSRKDNKPIILNLYTKVADGSETVIFSEFDITEYIAQITESRVEIILDIDFDPTIRITGGQIKPWDGKGSDSDVDAWSAKQ